MGNINDSESNGESESSGGSMRGYRHHAGQRHLLGITSSASGAAGGSLVVA